MNYKESVLAVLDEGADSKIAPILAALRSDGFITYKAHNLEEVHKLLPIQNLSIIVVLSADIDYYPFIVPFTKIRKISVLVMPYDDLEHEYALSEAMKIFMYFMDQRQDTNAKDIIVSGNILVDTKQHKVFVHDEEISMPKMEYDLLCVFIKSPGQILTYRYLYTTVWNEEYLEAPNILHSAVPRLRKCFHDCHEPIVIENARGVGYCYIIPAEPQ